MCSVVLTRRRAEGSVEGRKEYEWLKEEHDYYDDDDDLR